MERLPTWCVWRLLHGEMPLEKRNVWTRMLSIKHRSTGSQLSNIWVWVIISFTVSVITGILGRFILRSPSMVVMGLPLLSIIGLWIPLFILFLSLRYALRLSSTIHKQREIGNYALFALFPAGEFSSLLNIARAYRHPQQGRIIGILTFVILFGVAVAVTLRFPDNMFLNSFSLRFDPVAANVPSVMLRGLISFIDYLQSFMAAILIAILTMQQDEHENVQFLFIIRFIGLQIALYIISSAVGTWFMFVALRGLSQSDLLFSVFSTSLIFHSPILIICREIANFALWWIVQRRLEA